MLNARARAPQDWASALAFKHLSYWMKLLEILISRVLIVPFEGDEYRENGFEAKTLKGSKGLRENTDVKISLGAAN